MLEHKDAIYARFSKYMRPSHWIRISSSQHAVDELCGRLLESVGGQKATGTFYLKGSYSWGGMSVTKVQVTSGWCPDLAAAVRSLQKSTHQQCFCLQAEVTGFTEQELRHWFVAMAEPTSSASVPAPMRWRHCLTLKTKSDHTLTACVAAPLHVDSVACHDLAHKMMEENRPFFQELLRMGLHALRIDCGYDLVRKQAFFNEFAAAPDASMFTQTHLHDLVWRVGEQMAAGLWQLL
jgi:hypothetical protein